MEWQWAIFTVFSIRAKVCALRVAEKTLSYFSVIIDEKWTYVYPKCQPSYGQEFMAWYLSFLITSLLLCPMPCDLFHSCLASWHLRGRKFIQTLIYQFTSSNRQQITIKTAEMIRNPQVAVSSASAMAGAWHIHFGKIWRHENNLSCIKQLGW